MGFIKGVVEELNRQEDLRVRADEFMQTQLSKLKDMVLPDVMERISDRTDAVKERTARIDTAVEMGFTKRVATALEMTGQLNFQLAKIIDGGDNIDPNYITALNVGLEKRIDDDVELSKAVGIGLSGDLTNSEGQTQAMLNAYNATSREDFDSALANLMSYTGGSTSSEIDKPFDITATKGYKISLADQNNITKQVGDTLQIMFNDYFKYDQNQERFVINPNVEGSDDVEELMTDLNQKATELAESPFNTLSPVNAVFEVVNKIRPANGLDVNVIRENLDEAFTNPQFNWDRYRQ